MRTMRNSTRRRMRHFFNFISFNVLLFTLYLNFIAKDIDSKPAKQQEIKKQEAEIKAGNPAIVFNKQN